MLDYLYANAIASILLEEDASETLMKGKVEALITIYKRMCGLKKNGFDKMIIETIMSKKCTMLVAAKTKKEVELVAAVSKPHYDGCKIVGSGVYHVEEEELLLWSLTSLNAPLQSEAYARMSELFKRIYPDVDLNL